MLLYLGKLFLQSSNPFADQTAVAFQLLLSGTSGSNSTTEPGQRSAKTNQPGSTVTELGKLYLDLTFACGGMLGKNIKNQKGSVHDLAFQLMLQIVHLCRGKLIIADDSRCVCGKHQSAYLLDLAFSNIGSGMHGLTVLDDLANGHCASCICQFFQLIQGFLHIVVLIQLNAHQNHPLLYLFNIFHKSSFRTFVFYKVMLPAGSISVYLLEYSTKSLFAKGPIILCELPILFSRSAAA